jgi:hypothetical protein
MQALPPQQTARRGEGTAARPHRIPGRLPALTPAADA